MYGFDDRDSKSSDRLTLLTQSQIMGLNGHSEGEIRAYAKSFERLPDVSGIGGEFTAMIGRMGYGLVLLMLLIKALV